MGSQVLINYESPLINFKTVAVVPLFKNNGNPFFVLGFTLYMNTVVNFSADATYNIGFTGPNYDDFVNSDGTNSLTQGQYIFSEFSGTNLFPVPANTALQINITSGATATTYQGIINVQGFYL